MFKRDMPEHYQAMMSDLQDHAYTSTLYMVYDGAVYKGMFSSEDGALSLAVQFDNPAIYHVNKDNKQSHRVL